MKKTLQDVIDMDILRAPDFVTLISENPNTDACVHFETGDCLRILLTAKEERVKFIRLRWHLPMPPDAPVTTATI